MPIIFFTKKEDCDDCVNCSETMTNELITAFPKLTPLDSKSANWHISCLHEKNNHLVWVCIYEKDGKGLNSESVYETSKVGRSYLAKYKIMINKKTVTKGIGSFKTIETSNPKAVKYPKPYPTKAEIESVLNHS